MSNESDAPVEIILRPNGSYRVNGRVVIVDENGERTVKEGTFSLCRCGASKNKPFCDGTHREIGFNSQI